MSAEKVDYYLPWYVGDYLADTADLTCEEHGAYLLLLGSMWRAGGRLPCDHDRLARIAKLTRKRWDATWATLARFFELDSGHIAQRRLSAELKKARHRKQQATINGLMGGRPRKPDDNPPVSVRVTGMEPDTEPELNRNESSPSPSPSPKEEDQKTETFPGGNGRRKKKAIPPEYPEPFERIWASTGRSGNKFPAFQAWCDLGKPDPDAVIAGWRRAEVGDKRWPNYIPHLASWLNARGWEDFPGRPARVNGHAPTLEEIQAKEREERERKRLAQQFQEQRAAEVKVIMQGTAT